MATQKNHALKIFTFAVFVLLFPAARTTAQSQYATRVLAYDSTGANPDFTNPYNALGPPSMQATPFVPDNSNIVTVGANGCLVLGFDKPIFHTPQRNGGYDFVIYGNAFYVGGDIHNRYQKPGYVEVGVDVNHNGYDAGDPFYRLKGSPNPMSGYPFRGIDDRQFTTWGYANVTPTDSAGKFALPEDPFTSDITSGTAGGDAFRLAWAIDANGNPVTLKQVDFIRIHSAGTWYTAIDAVAIVSSFRLPTEQTKAPVHRPDTFDYRGKCALALRSGTVCRVGNAAFRL